MNPVVARLLNQQLYCPQFTQPEQVVAHLGAMQAQEYRLMRWAVEMRTKRPSAKAFEQAFNNGSIVRTHLMRGTWQLIAGKDYSWMMELLATKGIAVVNGWMHSNHITIDEKEYRYIRDILIEIATEKRSMTKEDIVGGLAERGIVMNEHRLSYHIRMAEYSGTLCNGDLLPMKPSYALVKEKLKCPQLQMERDEALMNLTRLYFQGHCPATLEDYVWWSGLGINDCRRGIALLGDYLHIEHWQGRDFYVTDDCRTHGFRKGKFLLIPPYDEYLIGYKSRDLVLDEEFRHRAHNNSGIFSPIIAYNGIICGNWSPFREGGEADFFLPLPTESTIAEEFAVYKEYLQK